jgi:hypothetical protein
MHIIEVCNNFIYNVGLDLYYQVAFWLWGWSLLSDNYVVIIMN